MGFVLLRNTLLQQMTPEPEPKKTNKKIKQNAKKSEGKYSHAPRVMVNIYSATPVWTGWHLEPLPPRPMSSLLSGPWTSEYLDNTSFVGAGF